MSRSSNSASKSASVVTPPGLDPPVPLKQRSAMAKSSLLLAAIFNPRIVVLFHRLRPDGLAL
jgi:hypothetical protein